MGCRCENLLTHLTQQTSAALGSIASPLRFRSWPTRREPGSFERSEIETLYRGHRRGCTQSRWVKARSKEAPFEVNKAPFWSKISPSSLAAQTTTYPRVWKVGKRLVLVMLGPIGSLFFSWSLMKPTGPGWDGGLLRRPLHLSGRRWPNSNAEEPAPLSPADSQSTTLYFRVGEPHGFVGRPTTRKILAMIECEASSGLHPKVPLRKSSGAQRHLSFTEARSLPS